MVYGFCWALSKERFRRPVNSPQIPSPLPSRALTTPPTMRLYAKADTRFSLTAVWSSWSFGTLTKCCRNAFSKWTVPFLPYSVGSTDYLAMQIDGPPPSTFSTAGFNQGEPAPSSQSAQRQRHHSGALTPTGGYSWAVGGQKGIKHTQWVSVFQRYKQPPSSSSSQLLLIQLNNSEHLAGPT